MDPDGTASAPVLVVLGAMLLGVLWIGYVRRLPRPFAWKVLAGSAVFLVVYAIVAGHGPVWLGRLVAVVSVCTFLGVLFLTTARSGRLILAKSKLRRNLRKAASNVELLEVQMDGPAPAELEVHAATLEGLGFERLFAAQSEDMVRIVLLRPRDGVVCEVVKRLAPPPRNPSPIIEFTSVLLGRRGLVCTSTSGIRLGGWDGELRQVFPGSDPPHLAEYHEDVLRFLRERNITADLVTADEIPAMNVWGRAAVAVATACASDQVLLMWARSYGMGAHLNVGPLTGDPRVEERLTAFWEAVTAEGAQPGPSTDARS